MGGKTLVSKVAQRGKAKGRNQGFDRAGNAGIHQTTIAGGDGMGGKTLVSKVAQRWKAKGRNQGFDRAGNAGIDQTTVARGGGLGEKTLVSKLGGDGLGGKTLVSKVGAMATLMLRICIFHVSGRVGAHNNGKITRRANLSLPYKRYLQWRLL